MTTMLLIAHATAAGIALPLGAYQLFRKRKGDARHALVGRVWVALMLWVALSSFAIRDINHGGFSFLHVLSVVTLVALARGMWTVRRGNISGHRGAMRGSWLGLLGAFVGAVAVPDRALPTFALTNPAGALAAAAAVLVTSWVVIALGGLLADRADGARARSARA
mgnify:FL=1